jgi:hypothetical protein
MKLDGYKFIQIKVDRETDTHVTFHIHNQLYRHVCFGGRVLEQDLHREHNGVFERGRLYSDKCSTWMLVSLEYPEARIKSRTLFCRGARTELDSVRLRVPKEEFDEVMKIVNSYNEYYGMKKFKEYKGKRVFCRTKRQNIINMDFNNEAGNQIFDYICTELEDFAK